MKPLTEFVGTFFFLFTVALAAPAAGPLAPLAIGGSLMVAVYMGGHRSGGHYNPAVSLAMFLQRKLTAKGLLVYWAAQILGGLAAFALGYSIMGKRVDVVPANGHGALAAFAVEVVYTAMLALVVLNTAATRKTEGNSYYGLAIGFAVVVAAIAAGPISGGAFNPAIGLCATIVAALHGGTLAHVWIPVGGGLLGGALASWFWAYQEAHDDAPLERPSESGLSQPATDVTAAR